MGEVSVSNASPLIFLSRGRHLDLLHHFAERVLVPEAVAVEIHKKGASDVTAKALESVPWLDVVEDLIRGGLYLSSPVLDAALRRVGNRKAYRRTGRYPRPNALHAKPLLRISQNCASITKESRTKGGLRRIMLPQQEIKEGSRNKWLLSPFIPVRKSLRILGNSASITQGSRAHGLIGLHAPSIKWYGGNRNKRLLSPFIRNIPQWRKTNRFGIRPGVWLIGIRRFVAAYQETAAMPDTANNRFEESLRISRRRVCLVPLYFHDIISRGISSGCVTSGRLQLYY